MEKKEKDLKPARLSKPSRNSIRLRIKRTLFGEWAFESASDKLNHTTIGKTIKKERKIQKKPISTSGGNWKSEKKNHIEKISLRDVWIPKGLKIVLEPVSLSESTEKSSAADSKPTSLKVKLSVPKIEAKSSSNPEMLDSVYTTASSSLPATKNPEKRKRGRPKKHINPTLVKLKQARQKIKSKSSSKPDMLDSICTTVSSSQTTTEKVSISENRRRGRPKKNIQPSVVSLSSTSMSNISLLQHQNRPDRYTRNCRQKKIRNIDKNEAVVDFVCVENDQKFATTAIEANDEVENQTTTDITTAQDNASTDEVRSDEIHIDTNSQNIGTGIDLRPSMTARCDGYKFMEPNRVTYQKAYPGVERAAFEDTHNTITGILKLSPRTVKPLKMSANSRHIYWILSGEVIVRSPEDLLKQGELNYLEEKELSSGSCLIVPCFTAYILENRSYTEDVLLGCVFVKTPDDNTRDLPSAK